MAKHRCIGDRVSLPAIGLLACLIATPLAHAQHHLAPTREALACQVPMAPCVGEGSWTWTRSPEQERRTSAALYNRYCIRCHGVDGRGIWDIPDVPNFADSTWQDSRSDAYLAQVLHFGRGAVMPPFRGTLTYDEYYGLARHLRTFDPRNQVPRPVSVGGSGAGNPVKPAAASTMAPAASLTRDASVRTAALMPSPDQPSPPKAALSTRLKSVFGARTPR